MLCIYCLHLLLQKQTFKILTFFQTSDEGSTISCVVERTRGALDYVYIKYIISQVDSTGINYSVTDFSNSSGTITFLPWQRSEVNPTFLLTINPVLYKPAGEYLLRVLGWLSYQRVESVYFMYLL